MQFTIIPPDNSLILFLTCMPLSQPKSASMVFLDVLLEKFPQCFAWFSLGEQEQPAYNPYDIPYAASPRLQKPARFPTLRLLLNYVIHSRVQAHQAAQFARKNGCKVVLADLAFEAVITGRLAAKYSHVPLLVNVHDDPINRINLKGHPAWFIRWYAKQFEKTLRAAKRVGVISDYMGEAYQQRYGIKTTTLYIGVEEAKCLVPAPLNIDKKPHVIGSIGSINSLENWNLLIEGVHNLNNKHGAGSFKIIHIGPFPENMILSEDVEVTGWLPEDQFLQQLERIDIGFLSWSFKPEHFETGVLSFPLKIHSFIQAQKPLLALGPEGSAVVRFVREHECGIWCTEFKADCMTKIIEKLLLTIGIYTRASSQMRGLAKLYSRNHFFDKFGKFISQL